MSLAVGLVSSSKNMGLDDDNAAKVSDKTAKPGEASADQLSTGMVRSPSEGSLCQTEDEDDDDEVKKIELGPQFTLKEQIEKDADDESLRRWKEQLLGSVDVNSVGETLEPEVKIMSLAIKSPGRSDTILPIPVDGNPKGLWFTLKEGSRYSLEFTFQLIARKKCLEHLVHSRSLTHMCCPRTQPHLAYWLGDLIQLEASLLTMTTSATWRLITPLISEKTGNRRKSSICFIDL